jgi:aerobic-type carbon monoxide dehydrogenase small subunit (CoxS/CutS family)
VDSCLVPAVTAQGCEVKTVEGLASQEELHPLQQSFIHQGGVQCGYCTPGLLMAGSTLLAERPTGLEEWQSRSALVGNLCRCTGYNKVLAAIREAQEV